MFDSSNFSLLKGKDGKYYILCYHWPGEVWEGSDWEVWELGNPVFPYSN